MTTIKSKKKARLRFCTAAATRQGLCLGIGICLVLIMATGQKATAQRQPKIFVPADEQGRAGGETVAFARATWDTGWFQTEIFKKLLEELGYTVKEPQTMDNLAFYLAAAGGQMDLWANGWFPSHHLFVEDERVRGRVEAVGFEVKAGALQGYLVDKKTADAMGIDSLGDLKDPKVAAVFDHNGNGKADLIGCNVGWGCERVVEHHLDAIVYDAPVLQHHAFRKGKGKVKVVGLLFEEQNYGIALQVRSPYREKINIALLKLIESGVYQEIADRWFGS